MADQPNTQDDDSTKKETIRITLPPKADQPTSKRETVRINVPGTSAPAEDATHKETAKIPMSGISVPPPPPAPPAPSAGTITKPLSGTPPPPKITGAPITKPLSGVTPPKPPPLTGKPTIPLRPAAPAGSAAVPPPTSGVRAPVPSQSGIRPPMPGQSGVVSQPLRPASPKKETARINLPSDMPKSAPALPKATVKMQQTQPLSKSPAPAISQAMPTMSVESSPAKNDTVATVLSVLAFLASGTALWFVYTIYEAAKPVPFP